MLYIENLKDSTKHIRINKFSYATGYKINKINNQKSVEFLNINNEQAEREINNTIYNCIRKIKYL